MASLVEAKVVRIEDRVQTSRESLTVPISRDLRKANDSSYHDAEGC